MFYNRVIVLNRVKLLDEWGASDNEINCIRDLELFRIIFHHLDGIN